MKQKIHEGQPDSITELKQLIQTSMSLWLKISCSGQPADLCLAKDGAFKPMEGCLSSYSIQHTKENFMV